MSRSYIDLQLAPHWELIDPTREYLLQFFGVMLRDERIAGQVSLAAHELMENAVKYSTSDEVRIRVEIEDGRWVSVAVENLAIVEHIPIVQAEIEAIRATADPLGFYQQKMEESYSRTDGKSCLGLARIRWEAEMSLDCQISGGMVRLIALREMEAAGGPETA